MSIVTFNTQITTNFTHHLVEGLFYISSKQSNLQKHFFVTRSTTQTTTNFMSLLSDFGRGRRTGSSMRPWLLRRRCVWVTGFSSLSDSSPSVERSVAQFIYLFIYLSKVYNPAVNRTLGSPQGFSLSQIWQKLNSIQWFIYVFIEGL